MNKAQRQSYLVLTRIELPKPIDGNLGLCHFCKYAEWTGNCYEADLECKHPIWKVADNAENAWAGEDCWGFRPKYRQEDCVDLVGIYLQGLDPDLEALEVKYGRN